MKEETLQRTMKFIIGIGLMLVIAAICLAVFAKLHISMGIKGVMIITATAGIGLILLLPSKLFLTLLLMKQNKRDNGVEPS
jgi:hypothetical protein